MKPGGLKKIEEWILTNPGIFQFREEPGGLWVLELYSGKSLFFKGAELQRVETGQNTLQPDQSYLGVLFQNGKQMILSPQGFAFPPDFSNTGPIPLPSQVYCYRDFQNLFAKLRHLTAEEERRREALDLLMILISLLDGARGAGLEMDQEAREVETVLSTLEK